MYDLLKGLRVVDVSAFVAGPTCGLYLAQMGAEVGPATNAETSTTRRPFRRSYI